MHEHLVSYGANDNRETYVVGSGISGNRATSPALGGDMLELPGVGPGTRNILNWTSSWLVRSTYSL